MNDSNPNLNRTHSPWDEGIRWRIKFAAAFQAFVITVGTTGFFLLMLILGRNPIHQLFGEKMMIHDALVTLGMLLIISLLCAGKSNPTRNSESGSP